MTLSMYQACVPVFLRGLDNLEHILKKGHEHANAEKIDPSVLLGARLYPNMFPLTRQVQVATDLAKGGGSRLAGQEPPSFEDKERTFEELLARIEKTRAHLKSFKPDQIDGSEERIVKLKVGGEPMEFQGLPYLLNFVIPNFFFHAATAYDILRHNGVVLGKRDFIGSY